MKRQVRVREKRGIPQETTIVGLPEWSARPLIAIRDEEIKEKAIIKCMERLNGEIGAGRGNLLYSKMPYAKVLRSSPVTTRGKKRNYLLSGPVVVHAHHLIDDIVNLVYQVLRSHNLVPFKQFPFFHNSNTSLIARTSADNLPFYIHLYTYADNVFTCNQ